VVRKRAGCACCAAPRFPTISTLSTALEEIAMPPTSTATHTIALAPGDVLHLPVAAGAQWRVVQGRVQVRGAPRWLADRLVSVEQTLEPGQVYTATDAGWAQLVVLGAGAVQLVGVRPADTAARRAPWWRMAVQRSKRSIGQCV
jgi:hypothetical protein